jgi:hypothetical protein
MESLLNPLINGYPITEKNRVYVLYTTNYTGFLVICHAFHLLWTFTIVIIEINASKLTHTIKIISKNSITA